MATRKPRQSGSVEDCAVQQALWTIGGKWGVSRKEVGAIAGLSDLPEQFGGIDGLRTAVLHRPVYNEVWLQALHSTRPKEVRGSYLRRILVYLCLGHGHLAFNLNLSQWHSCAIPG